MYFIENGALFLKEEIITPNQTALIVTCLGQEVLQEETETEVIITDVVISEDGSSFSYVERERLTKEVDNPETTDVDEGASFWQRVAGRLLFWRGN